MLLCRKAKIFVESESGGALNGIGHCDTHLL